MKKLNKLVLNKAKIMSAPQMKNITGGYDFDGSCCYLDSLYGAQCGVSRALAEYYVSVGIASNWCCDNCGGASWMQE